MIKYEVKIKVNFIHKLLGYYKNIRINFIITELILLCMCLSIMISVSYGLVSFYLHIK